MKSRLSAHLDEQSDLLHCLMGNVECILESLPIHARDQEGMAETTNVHNKDTYQTPPTIIFDDDTPVEVGDEVESETVLSLAGEPVMAQK